jgi:predicted acylesterase/phospholipase RssA
MSAFAVSSRMKTAFFLAGGGSVGSVHVSMLRALVQSGVDADRIVGSSVGAVNAASFAGNPHTRWNLRHGSPLA